MSKKCTTFSVLMACGPSRNTIIDSIDSLHHYFKDDSFEIVLVDDDTTDGTYELLLENKKNNWHIIRNEKKYGYVNLAQTLCKGYQYIFNNIKCDFVFKMDTDTLVIGHGLVPQVKKYIQQHPKAGLFGVYAHDYNRPRDFSVQKRSLDTLNSSIRSVFFMRPSWCDTMKQAEENGYTRGENVFGGAYFLTYDCLESFVKHNFLNFNDRWYNSNIANFINLCGIIFKRELKGLKGSIAEDVYFSILAYASGYTLGHFAAPEGPLCLEYKGLPHHPQKLIALDFKVVHSVDKGPHTGREENGGYTAREYFRLVRERV